MILAVDNGDITGNEPYREDHIHMHRGCASVLIVLTGEPGRVSVWADSDGMRSGQITLCRVDKMGCIKRIMEEQNGTIFFMQQKTALHCTGNCLRIRESMKGTGFWWMGVRQELQTELIMS